MEHIEYWGKKHRHPISKTIVVVSVAPKSEYVKLYKEAIKILVKGKEKSLLSIEDCDIIRSHLPSSHCVVNKKKYVGFEYDHLFVKYFLNNKKYNYVPEYVAYGTDMFLYLHLYKCIKRKPPQDSLTSLTSLSSLSTSSSSFEKDYQTTEDLLYGNINRRSFTTGELSISKRIEKSCEDIKAVLYLMSSPLTIEQYDKVCKNMKVLQYVYDIYKLTSLNKITDSITIISVDEAILYIYKSIIDIPRIPNFFDFLLNIYRKIELLYRYCFPYYYIYNNSNNCKKNMCSISHTYLNDDYILDTGEISILPYFKGTKLKDNINEYSCYLTEGLYQWIQWNAKSGLPIRNPRTKELLTPYDIIYVYENKIKLIDREIERRTGDLATLTSEKTYIINLLTIYNKVAKEQFEKLEEQASNEIKKGVDGLFTFSRSDDDENGKRYLYLNLHLGDDIPIDFKLKYSHDIDISKEMINLNERLKTFRGGKKIKYPKKYCKINIKQINA
jgi:hypothetical protein